MNILCIIKNRLSFIEVQADLLNNNIAIKTYARPE